MNVRWQKTLSGERLQQHTVWFRDGPRQKTIMKIIHQQLVAGLLLLHSQVCQHSFDFIWNHQLINLNNCKQAHTLFYMILQPAS